MNTQTEKNDDATDSFKEELEAMKAIGDAVQPLKQASRERVLQWAASHFLVTGVANVVNFPKAGPTFSGGQTVADNSNATFADLPALFDATSPKTQSDKALVGGYWEQECEGKPDFGSQDINSALKHLGHGVGNITDAFNGLIAQKLVMQIRKSGVTKQARKKYKLTREGIKRVQQMLQNATDE